MGDTPREEGPGDRRAGDAGGRAASEPAPELPPPRRAPLEPIADRVALVVVPTAVGVALAALLALEPRAPTSDLRLLAPPTLPTDGTVGLRARLLAGLDDPRGPHLAGVPVEVRAVDAAGVEVGRARLAPTPFDTLAGTLEVRGAAGPVRLVADAGEAAPPTTVVRGAAAVPAPLATQGRLASPLAQLRHGPLRAAEGARPPDALDLRVVGGACVPRAPCRLLVHVGEPAAALSIEAPPEVELVGAVVPDEETGGVVEATVVVRGPEAPVTLVARRAGAVVARRAVRLPLALGAPVVEVAPLVAAGASPEVHIGALDGRRGAIVDLLHDGRWARSGSAAFDADEAPLPLPGGPLPAGLWRVQAQVDPFELGLTGTRVVYATPDPDARAALRGLVARLRRDAVDDAFLPRAADAAGAGAAGTPAGEAAAQRAAAFLLAGLESELAVPPAAEGGRDAHLRAARARAARLRGWVAAVVALAGVWVALHVARRGLRASAEARAILLVAGDPNADDALHRRRMTLAVLGLAAAVALGFVAAVTLVLALGLVDR